MGLMKTNLEIKIKIERWSSELGLLCEHQGGKDRRILRGLYRGDGRRSYEVKELQGIRCMWERIVCVCVCVSREAV